MRITPWSWKKCEDMWTIRAHEKLTEACQGERLCLDAVGVHFDHCRKSVPPKVDKLAQCINKRSGKEFLSIGK